MYDRKRFDLQYRGNDVQVWQKGSLAALVRVATFHNLADEFKEAGFKTGDTIELTLRKAPEKSKKHAEQEGEEESFDEEDDTDDE